MKVLTISAVAIAFLMLAPTTPAQDVDLTAHVRVANQGKHNKAPRPAGTVMWLTPIDRNAPIRPFSGAPLKLTQIHKSFQPHLLVVPVGAVVEFPNRDPFFHNVFSLFDGKRFDLGLYEAGSTRNVSFDRYGVSYIFCNIHAEMSAVVIALDTPYYGIANAKGEIAISQVPAGRYMMHTWYETALPATLNALTREVTVTSTSSSLGTIDVAAEVAATHKDKYGMDYEPPSPNTPGYDHP